MYSTRLHLYLHVIYVPIVVSIKKMPFSSSKSYVLFFAVCNPASTLFHPWFGLSYFSTLYCST